MFLLLIPIVFLLHTFIARYVIEMEKSKKRNRREEKKKNRKQWDRRFMSYKKHRTTGVIPIFPMGFDRLTAKNRNFVES